MKAASGALVPVKQATRRHETIDAPTATRSLSWSGEGWEQLFWTVFKQSGTPVALFDADRRFVDVNDATLEVFGRTRGDLLGRPIADLIKPSEQEDAVRVWEAFQLTGETAGTRTMIRGDGTEMVIEFAARIAIINGNLRAVYVIVADPWKRMTPAEDMLGTTLTPREREVVRLVAMGLETKQIAARLYISPETVRTHVRNAMGRLQVRTRAQLVAAALTGDPSLQLLRLGD